MELFALFDWDKTIRSKSYVMIDFIKILVEKGIVNKNIQEEMNEVSRQHLQGTITYTEMAEKSIQIYRKIY